MRNLGSFTSKPKDPLDIVTSTFSLRGMERTRLSYLCIVQCYMSRKTGTHSHAYESVTVIVVLKV